MNLENLLDYRISYKKYNNEKNTQDNLDFLTVIFLKNFQILNILYLCIFIIVLLKLSFS